MPRSIASFTPHLSFPLLATLVACGQASGDAHDSDTDASGRGPTASSSATDGASPEGAVSFSEHVAPILADHCYRCHFEGGAGGFELRTYQQAKRAGRAIAKATRDRVMPPWLADNSGSCQTYFDSNWLSEAQIQTIADWVEGGMPEGDPSKMPTFREQKDHLTDPTVTLVPAEPYTPNIVTDDDDYRCFIIDPGLTKTQFLTEYEVLAENPAIVHHVIVYEPSSAAAVQEATALDAKEAGPGFTCFGGPIVDATVAAAWAPGRYRWSYPAGMGVPIEANRPLIVQVHYHVDDAPVPDVTKVALKLVDQVDQELLPWFYADTSLALPAGKSKTQSIFEMSTSKFMEFAGTPGYAKGMNIVGIAAHMHKLGVSERIERTKADGSATECVLDVPRWDFNWQYAYFLEKPMRLEPDDLLRMSCSYDTSSTSTPTYWGEGTDEEMCLALVYSTFDGGKIPSAN